jgi:hypothetical protein
MWLSLLLCISEVQISNLGIKTDCLYWRLDGFLRLARQMLGLCIRIGHDHFLRYFFQLIDGHRNIRSSYKVSLGGVRLSPLGTSATDGLLYQPRMIDDDDYGAVGGMRIGRGNRSTRRKPAPVPLCPHKSHMT